MTREQKRHALERRLGEIIHRTDPPPALPALYDLGHDFGDPGYCVVEWRMDAFDRPTGTLKFTWFPFAERLGGVEEFLANPQPLRR